MDFFGHLCTVSRHRALVLTYCVRAGIPLQGLTHDLSKFSPVEWVPGVLYYQGNRSPNERERELCGCSRAWMHHKGRNPHHYEYWYDVAQHENRYVPVPMPLRYIAEMFCDRVAASKTYLGDKYCDRSALDYYLKSGVSWQMHPNTAKTLETWLKLLAEEGEEVAFAHIRCRLRHEARHAACIAAKKEK